MNKLAVLATVASVAATQSVIVNKTATIEVDSNCTVTFTKMENFTGNATVNSTVHTLNTRFNCTGINTSKLANNELPYVAVTFLPGTNSAPAANNDVSYCYLKGYTTTLNGVNDAAVVNMTTGATPSWICIDGNQVDARINNIVADSATLGVNAYTLTENHKQTHVYAATNKTVDIDVAFTRTISPLTGT